MRLLSDPDIAFIMECRENHRRPSGQTGKNFWWAIGQVFGLDPEQAKHAIKHAEKHGIQKVKQ